MDYEKVSKKLSYMLSHCQIPLYISRDGGWASVDKIIKDLNIRLYDLDKIVSSDDKNRYSYNHDKTKIRANQGHSIPGVVIKMEQPEPPKFLYHGTSKRFLNDILKEGLKPMSRNFVHISNDLKTAIQVGKRHGQPVILLFRAEDFIADGNKLYLSENGVWQAEYIPPEYLSVFNINFD